jgi:pilus assembly protein CpaB
MRNKLIFILALLFGLLAAFLVYNYLNHLSNPANGKGYSDVVVAVQDIPANSTITTAMVELKKYPNDLKTTKELVLLNDAVGKVSLIGINKGEVILNNQIIAPGDNKEGLAYTIPEGFRAMSVPIDEVTGVAGMIKKGDKVDVVSFVTTNANPPQPFTVVVLQNIQVLAYGTTLTTDKAVADKGTQAKSATLAVSLDDSLKLKMALQKGNISLLLRSPADQSTASPAPFGGW